MAKTKTTVSFPSASAAETRRNTLADLLQQIQIENLGYSVQDDAQGNPLIVPRQPTAQEQSTQDFWTKMQAKIQEQLLGAPVDEATRAEVGKVFSAARTTGTQEIDRFIRELAGARGLDLTTDSPALQEAARAKGNLETSLGGAEAESLLNFGQQNRIAAQALMAFQNNMRQQAFVNRGIVQGGYSQGAELMQRERMAQPTTTSKTSGGGFDFNSFLSGAGGLLRGLGEVGVKWT